MKLGGKDNISIQENPGWQRLTHKYHLDVTQVYLKIFDMVLPVKIFASAKQILLTCCKADIVIYAGTPNIRFKDGSYGVPTQLTAAQQFMQRATAAS